MTLQQGHVRIEEARVSEPEYPASMLVRNVHHQGQIRWKKHDVGLSQVLWGERVGPAAAE